jgi:hypothetical protein
MVKLQTSAIVWTWDETYLKRPNEVRQLTQNFLDSDGNSLLEDLPGNEIYLSKHYDDKKLPFMCIQLGILQISNEEIVQRIEADVDDDNSKMKSKDTEDDWHMKFALLLMKIPKSSGLLDRLKLIPL